MLFYRNIGFVCRYVGLLADREDGMPGEQRRTHTQKFTQTQTQTQTLDMKIDADADADADKLSEHEGMD